MLQQQGAIKIAAGKSIRPTITGVRSIIISCARGFEAQEGSEAQVFINFDVRKSIVEVHDNVPLSFKLKPTLRLVKDFNDGFR